MKRILALGLLIALPALAQVSPPSIQSRVAGRFVAYNYGRWSLPIYSFPSGTGSKTFTLSNSTVQLGDGRVIMPFNTNAQVKVGTETVTITAVGAGCIIGSAVPGGCSLTATFSSTHSNADRVSSATFGLQESLNDAGASGGGAVTVDSAWAGLGGTTGIKNAATLPANTAIEDVRTGTGGGTPTALSPNPTRVGQTWSWLHGAAPNQGWSDLMAQWYNPYDYGAAGDGTTNDDAAFTDMLAAAVASGTPYNIMLMPRTGPFVLTLPVDLSAANIVFASYDPTFTGTILYNGVDAGPAIYMAQNTFGSFVAVRGTSTAAQTIVKMGDGYAEDLEVYSADASNNFVSVDFEGHFSGAVLEFISTDSPVNVGSSVHVDIKAGSVNNQSQSMVTTDPLVIGSNSILTLGTVNVLSHNTANTAACMIKLPDYHNNYVTLNNVTFTIFAGYTGHVLCGPTGALADGVPTINGTIKSYFDAAFLFSGKLGGTIEMPGNNFSDKETSAIVFTNGIATQGLFYSAAGVVLPTPAFPGPITSYVSDQTAACTGTYTSGAAVKCKVWWNGTNWIAY